MLRRLSEFALRTTNEINENKLELNNETNNNKKNKNNNMCIRVLYHIQVISAQLEESNLVNDKSELSVCFVTDGKLSVSSDKLLQKENNSNLLSAEFNDKLSLLVTIPLEENHVYQKKKGKIVIRQKRIEPNNIQSNTDSNNENSDTNTNGTPSSYIGLGIISIPLYDFVSTKVPESIRLHFSQVGEKEKKGIVIVNISSKLISEVQSSNDELLIESDHGDSLNLMIAADFSHSNELISFPHKLPREVSENTTETNDVESSSHEEIILQKSHSDLFEDEPSREIDELLQQNWILQQSIIQKDARITELEKEIVTLISSLNIRKSANQVGSVIEFNNLKNELMETKKELWKEKTSKEALQLAHSRADMALAVSLSTEKERADCIENEYILASLKIKQLEESLSLFEANQQIYASPGRNHLERHNEKIKLLHQQNHSNLSTPLTSDVTTTSLSLPLPQSQSQSPKPSSSSLVYSAYVTPTKSSGKSTIFDSESKYDLVVNIPKSAVEFPLNSSTTKNNNWNGNGNGNYSNNDSNSNNQSNQEIISSPINMENILDELIHSKLLLASLAAELQEEKHVVHILSKANQKYAEKLAMLEIDNIEEDEKLRNNSKEETHDSETNTGRSPSLLRGGLFFSRRQRSPSVSILSNNSNNNNSDSQLNGTTTSTSTPPRRSSVI